MKKILYISGLNKKNRKHDGERIKNTYIFNSLEKKYKITLINLSSFKILNTIKIFFHGLFLKNKYDYIIISKDPHGANIIHIILKIVGCSFDKVVYFEIGPFLFDRIKNGTIKKEIFMYDRIIVVETDSMKRELESLGFTNIDVFPNFKPIIEINFVEKQYPKKVLDLVFLSRIEEAKGIYDLIEVLSEVNGNGLLFRLDIYGRIQSIKDEDKIKQYLDKNPFIRYCGKMDVDNQHSYEILSQYDLHVFPTKYSEGFPGSIIDFFIAGVPTFSSSFARANEILSTDDSIIFKQFDKDDMREKLIYVYNNQFILNSMRTNAFKRRNDYSVETFEVYLEKIIGN